jgi:hypothetical protein
MVEGEVIVEEESLRFLMISAFLHHGVVLE